MTADGGVEASGRYSVAFYRRGPAWDRQKPLGQQPAIYDHIAYLQRLIAQGTVSQAGPFHGFAETVAEGLVGMAILRADVDGAAELAVHDPAIQARLMEWEAGPWYP